VGRDEVFALVHCTTCNATLRVRTHFDHFRIEATLGAGGMGAVYRANDTNLKRPVALKLLRKEYSDNPDFVRQFQTEAAATASIHHPHVVKVYSSGSDHGVLYIAMELVDQGSLESLMEHQGKIDELEVLGYGIQIAQGLKAALQSGLIHRDIKPGNILFAEGREAKIVDFGLAALVDADKTSGGDVWGTPYYVPPETLDDQHEDARSDIYALGATLYHAIAGRPPFLSETISIVELLELKKSFDPLQKALPEVAPATAAALNRTLAFDPSGRPQTYDELLLDLEFARKELKASRTAAARRKAGIGVSYEWITWSVAAAIVAAGVSTFWTLLPNSAETADVQPSAPAIPAGPTPEQRFAEARALLFSDKFPEAAAKFADLSSETVISEPVRNWVALHHALALLLAADNTAADTVFAAIEQRGLFTNAPDEQTLAHFFLDSAHLLQASSAIPREDTAPFQKPDYHGFALLLAGLKNWNLGEFESASQILSSFNPENDDIARELGVDPEAPAQLQKIATTRTTHFRTFKPLLHSLTTAPDSAAQKKAVAAARDALESLSPALSKALLSAVESAETRLKAAEEEMARMMAEKEAADTKLLGEAKQKRLQLAFQFQFTKSREALAAAELATDAAKAEHAHVLAKTDVLIRFKDILVRDINLQGSRQRVARRNGTYTLGLPAKADDLLLHTKTQFGLTAIPWADIHPESIYAMAKEFLRPGQASELEPERRWTLAAYASLIGKPADCRTLLNEAATLNPALARDLEAFLQSAETP